MRFSGRAISSALLAVGLWASNAFAADIALARLSVAQLLLLQYGSAAVVLAAGRAMGRRGGLAPPRAAAVPVAVSVIGLTGTIFLQYLAFASAPIVAANVLAYAWPLLAATWLAVVRRTRETLVGVPLGMLGFGGVTLIFGAGDTHLTGATLGYAAALGSAACMAFFTVAAGRLTASVLDLLIPATLVGTATAGAWVMAQSSPWPAPQHWLVAIYIGIGPMAAGYALWGHAMSGSGADRLSAIGYATPLLSTTLLIATGQPAGTHTLIGVGLILVCSLGTLVNAHHHRLDPDCAFKGS